MVKNTDTSDKSYFLKSDSSPSLFAMLRRIPFLESIITLKIKFLLKAIRVLTPRYRKGNIVILALIRIGDTVFSLPAVRKVIERHPVEKIFITCYPESKTIYEAAGIQAEIKIIKKSDFFFNRRFGNRAARKVIRECRPLIIYDLTGSVTSASVIFNSRAARIFGYNLEMFRTIYTKYRQRSREPHLIDHYLDAVELAGAFPRTREMYINKPLYDPAGYILIHPLAIRKSKEWNFNKYIQLCSSLNLKYEVKLVLPGGTVSEDIIIDIREAGIPVIITVNINELIELIRGCSLYISNDTGPLYIANILGKPTFTIYGPTNPEYSLPFGDHNRYIRNLIACSPYKHQECITDAGINCPVYECMNSLKFETVNDAVIQFLSELEIKEKRASAG